MISGILLILCLLFFPGFFTVKILFQKKDGLGSVETLFLSTAFSLCAMLLVYIVLNFTLGLKTSLPLVIIAAYTFLAAFLCLVRNKPAFSFRSPEEKKAFFMFCGTLTFLFVTTYRRDFDALFSLRKYVFIGDTQFFVYNALRIMHAGHYVPWQNTMNYAPGLFFTIMASYSLTHLHPLYLCNLWATIAPLLIFTGVYALSCRLLKNSFFSLFAALLYVSQIANYKYFMGTVFDPFMFVLILLLFLLNKPLLSGFAVSTVLYLHQYPINAVPVVLLYVLCMLFLYKNTAKQYFSALAQFLLCPALLIVIFSVISPFLLSPQPRGQAKDLLTGIPTQIFIHGITASGAPWFERFLRIMTTFFGAAGCILLILQALREKARTHIENNPQDARPFENLLYVAGFLVMLAFALMQPFLYKLGIDYNLFPFNAITKSMYEIQMNKVTDFSVLRMFKRFFFWMEPARPLVFFYIFASMCTARVLQGAVTRQNNKNNPAFYAAISMICSLFILVEIHFISIKKQTPSADIFYGDWDKTYVSSSDLDAMLWIFNNTSFNARVGITNMNGKPDPQITHPQQKRKVTNQNRIVTAFTMRDVNEKPLPVKVSKYRTMFIINLSHQDVFLLQSIEKQLIPTITVIENGRRSPLKTWGMNNRARTKIFYSGKYESILLFSKPFTRRNTS